MCVDSVIHEWFHKQAFLASAKSLKDEKRKCEIHRLYFGTGGTRALNTSDRIDDPTRSTLRKLYKIRTSLENRFLLG